VLNSAIKRIGFEDSDCLRKIEYGRVLKIFMIPLFVVGFMNGINASMISFVYFGLVGIYVGASYEIAHMNSNRKEGAEC